MRAKRISIAAIAGLLCAALPTGSAGSTADLARRAVLTIGGSEEEQGAGYAIAAAGDVNGDSVADLLVRPSIFQEGDVLAYVVFGGSSDGVDLGSLGGRGFAITTSASTQAGDLRSYDVTGSAGAGDVDGDGLDDVLVGVPWADGNGRKNSGSVYVVFGKSDTEPVDVTALAGRGIRIDGAGEKDETGVAVAAADVDGDSIPDVVVGAPNAGGDRPPGDVFVLFGRDLTADVDLAQPFDGLTIEGPLRRQTFGAAVANAGDMNGDGRDELVVGAPSASYRVRSGAYVVFGRDAGGRVVLEDDESAGWEIRADRDGDDGGDAGRAVAGGGDFNGDGTPDVLIGAPDEDVSKRAYSGAAYVIFGAGDRPDVRLDELGDAGLQIAGPHDSAATGGSVAFVPDVNGDGLAEAVVGSPDASDFGAYDTGRVDFVPGRSPTERVDLADAPEVLTYIGEDFEGAGTAVAYAGDFGGTGEDLIAVGAPYANVDKEYDAGLVYLAPVSPPVNDLPPRATLVSYSARQRGLEGNYCWDGVCVDRAPSFPRREPASVENAALIRFGIAIRPDETALSYYRKLDEFGRPAGNGRPVDHRVRPIDRRHPEKGFELFFHLPRRTGAAYLALQARWEGDDRGDASWFFHLDLDDQTYTDISGPPDSHLTTGSTRQRGLTLTYSWSQQYVDGTASTLIADAFTYGFPDAKPAVHGARASIRIQNRHRPDDLSIRLSRHVEREGEGPWASEYPRGRRVVVDYSWRTVRRHHRVVAHEAVFRLPNDDGPRPPPKHAYLEVRGRWRSHGTAPWQFHLRFPG